MNVDVQVHRTNVTARAPTASSKPAGTLWINMADNVIGYFDDTGTTQKLTAIPNFSQSAGYTKNALVIANNRIAKAVNTVSAGSAFAPNDWVYVDGMEVYVNAVAPTNPADGQLWVDISIANNPALKIWDATTSAWDLISVSQKILAESLLMGSIVGWDLVVAGADLDFPDTLTWTKGGETIRAQIVWSAQKDVQRVVWQASTATGTMAAIGTYTVRYNTSQQIVGGVWS